MIRFSPVPFFPASVSSCFFAIYYLIIVVYVQSVVLARICVLWVFVLLDFVLKSVKCSAVVSVALLQITV